jgi:molybdate transport system substrate-binding protein
MAPILEIISLQFKAQTGTEVLLSVGSTGNLAAQIENGGPFDVFLSADPSRVDNLINSGHLEASSRTSFARGILVLATAPDLQNHIESLIALDKSAVRTIAIANPDHAPYGLAAQQALQSIDIWETVQGKIITAESVGQAALFVSSGNASAGLLAESVAMNLSLAYRPVPDHYYTSIEHVAAMLSTSQSPELARAFIELMVSANVQQLLDERGFALLEQ